MKKVEALEPWLRRTAALISGLCSLSVEHWFHENLKTHAGISWSLAILSFLVLLEAAHYSIEHLSDWLVEKKRFRKWACGRYWFEGTWFDIVVDKETGEVINTGVISIFSNEGRLVVGGAVRDRHGHRLGSFRSDHVQCKDGRIEFIYYRVGRDKISREYGYAEYTFVIPTEGVPYSYTGEFNDNGRHLHSEAFREQTGSILEKDDGPGVDEEIARRVDDFEKKRPAKAAAHTPNDPSKKAHQKAHQKGQS